MDNENDTLASLIMFGNPTKLLSASLHSSVFATSERKNNIRSNHDSNVLYIQRVCNQCSIMSTRARHFFEFEDSRPFQLFDLLLDHALEGLVVYESRQFSSTVPPFILSHLSLNIPVDCNVNAEEEKRVNI